MWGANILWVCFTHGWFSFALLPWCSTVTERKEAIFCVGIISDPFALFITLCLSSPLDAILELTWGLICFLQPECFSVALFSVGLNMLLEVFVFIERFIESAC